MNKASKTKILVVDDDIKLLQDVQRHLEKFGYEVTTAPDGPAALKIARSTPFDLVVLDINFPETKQNPKGSIDGIEVLRSLRDSCSVPVLMLSSTNIVAVKVMTLAIGADDYISKPFHLQELSARMEAILRRSRGESHNDDVLSFRRLRMDPGERRVWKDGNPIELTAIEFDLLCTLARRPQHAFTRDKLLELAWKDADGGSNKSVDVHIGHIRKKIEDDPSQPALIVTVHGVGYRFEDVPSA